MKKSLVSLIFMVMLCNLSLAYGQDSDVFSYDYFGSGIFYKGDISISLDKGVYNAGEEIKAEITAVNMEEFPVVDAYLVIDMVSGDKKHVYPSMQSDADKVFYEATVRNISIGPLSGKTVAFSYRIPGDIKTGNYRFEVYLLTSRTPIVGIPHIFLDPKYKSVFIKGTGSFPGAYISRTKTVFGSVPGPVGVGVNKSSYVNGTVFIQSDSNNTLNGLTLRVTVCEWDDTACAGGVFFYSEYPVQQITAESPARVDVKFVSPKKPGAYSIRLEVVDGSNRTVSLYRSRIIVQGETGRIRKMAINSSYYKKGQEGNITVLVGASPDHYTYPKLKDAVLSVSLKDRGGIIFAGESAIPELSIATGGGLLSYSYPFLAEREITGYTLCSRLESKSGTLYDEYCYAVNSSEVVSQEQNISVDWNYNYDYGLLDIRICAEDAFGAPASSKASVVLMSYDEARFMGMDENLTLASCERISYKVPQGLYKLIINDLGSMRQTNYVVRVSPPEKASNISVITVCGDGRCDYSEKSGKCCIDCGCPPGRNCTNGVCVKEPVAEVCGNGVCAGDENINNCCVDCQCPYGKVCSGEQCISDAQAQRSGNQAMFYVGTGLIVLGIAIFFITGKKRPPEKQKKPGGKLRGA